MNEIRIKVYGATGVGKSIVAEAIKRVLVQHGFATVQVVDDELSDMLEDTLYNQRMDDVAPNTAVVIETVQVLRARPNQQE